MTRRALGCGFLCAAALTASVAAQSPAQTQPAQTAPPQTSASAPAPSVAPAGVVSVEGCLFQEADVPGRRPPEEMRAQVKADDDYVLAMTKVIKGSAPSPAPSRPDDTPTGTSGVTAAAALMYEIEGLEKAQLREHVGRRVQIDGSFENLDRAKNPVSFATDLVELRGISIRPVAGECPTK